MRTFRIRSTVAAIAAALPLSVGLDAHAEDPASMNRSPAATMQDGRKLVGKDLYGANGEEVGEISNVLIEGGDASAVLVDVGGFLGIGSKTVAIPVDDLQVGQDRVTAAGLTEESAKNMPEYHQRDRASYGSLVNRDNQTAWERESARDTGTTGTTRSSGSTPSTGASNSGMN